MRGTSLWFGREKSPAYNTPVGGTEELGVLFFSQVDKIHQVSFKFAVIYSLKNTVTQYEKGNKCYLTSICARRLIGRHCGGRISFGSYANCL